MVSYNSNQSSREKLPNWRKKIQLGNGSTQLKNENNQLIDDQRNTESKHF